MRRGDRRTGRGRHGRAGPSLLPGWTRKHVVAHLAANAEALGRLLHWAKTGERTPMYSSTEQRNADIEAGATRPGTELAQWFRASAQALDDALDTMTRAAWSAEVMTAQGPRGPGHRGALDAQPGGAHPRC